jgi:glycosyltransferase involved in cell wall biosynthesis
MTTLSVVIPAYNEESGIADIVNRVLQVREDLSEVGVDELELLVVNDGSSDKTAAIVSDIAAQESDVRLISHETNHGYGAALKTGFSVAQGELVGFLDADGTYPPEYFPILCHTAMNGADLVIGSRMAGQDSQMPITRRIGNLFFANLLSLVARQKVSDSASGMRVFRKEILERIYPLPDGLNLTPVMSTRALHEQVTIAEVPIPYSERVGNSKLSVVHDGSVFLQSIVWTSLTYNPVRILGGIGLALMALAMFILLGFFIMRLQGITTLGPWGVVALFIAAVSGFAGFSIFSLGITFNYMVSLFYKEPIRQGLFGKPVFDTPIDRNFWWMGAIVLLLGSAIGIASIILGTQGWDTNRLWFYMLGSAMLILTGIQLFIYWVQMRVLEELSKREALIAQALVSQKGIPV